MAGMKLGFRDPFSNDWTTEPKLVGFSMRELLQLRRVLDTLDMPMERALTLLGCYSEAVTRSQERAWREHFGILTELW